MFDFKRLLFVHTVAVVVLGLFLGLHPPLSVLPTPGDRNENLKADRLGNQPG